VDKLKNINASTLPEVIVSMAITTFLFGFVAWFIVGIDQRKYIDNEMAIFTYHLNFAQESINNNEEELHTVFEDISINIHQTQSKLHKNLVERTVVIKNKNNRVIYTFSQLLLCRQENNE